MTFPYTTSTCSSCFTSKPNCFTHLANTIHTLNTTSIHGTSSSSSYLIPCNEHFDLLDDPFDQIISSIPSPHRISSSPRCSTQTIKRKTTKYKDYLANLVTIYDFPIDEATMIHEALTSSKGEHWKEAMESKYVSLLKNQTWR
jgi:hypothetical protein